MLPRVVIQYIQDLSPIHIGMTSVWIARSRAITSRLIGFFWVVIIYLCSELLIWGLSRLLSLVQLQFLASILGMILAFALMAMSCKCYPSAKQLYLKHLRSKVDFINAHLGVGFPIPLVMLDQSNVLDGSQISRVIGNFVITNLASWTVVYLMSLLTLTLWFRTLSEKLSSPPIPEVILSRSLVAEPLRLPAVHLGYDSRTFALEAGTNNHSSGDETDTPLGSHQTSMLEIRPYLRRGPGSHWRSPKALYPIVLSLSCAFALGAPIAAGTGDVRILDICILWFVWISWVRMQRLFKDAQVLLETPKLKNAIATLMNPVLATTLLMTGYVHAKSAALYIDLPEILRTFSRGTPLSSIWTASVTGVELVANPDLYVGAGDLALSILEVGIVIWGLKLYECRHQLWSVAGLFAVVISIIAAAGNVYLSVLSGRLIGLENAESLAFAARSTTLALAKPAIEAVGGNLAVNAALVVSNGIFGQLMYPFILDKLGVEREDDLGSNRSSTASTLTTSSISQSKAVSQRRLEVDGIIDEDSPSTIAAGIAIGINGAAMGVAYLYETKSRAAPYAALSMTVFGVMTVVFTSVGPFKAFILTLVG